jgi:hypothetical protein
MSKMAHRYDGDVLVSFMSFLETAKKSLKELFEEKEAKEKSDEDKFKEEIDKIFGKK